MELEKETKMRTKHPQWRARLKFHRHRAQSKFRNIDFNFDFDTWYAWWLSNGIDKNIDEFDNTDTSRPCMCRINDTGAYEPGNVYMDTQYNNMLDMHTVYSRGGKKRNLTKKIYRWGTQHMNLYELEECLKQHGIDTRHTYKYHHSTYDYNRRREWIRLARSYTREIGGVRRRTSYTTPDGVEHSTQKQIAQHLGCSSDRVRQMLHLGEITRTLYGPSLDEYRHTHSIFPNPWTSQEQAQWENGV